MLFEFHCNTCNQVEEKFVESSTREALCSSCGGTTHRIVSPVRCKLEGLTGAFPTASQQWVKKHQPSQVREG